MNKGKNTEKGQVDGRRRSKKGIIKKRGGGEVGGGLNIPQNCGTFCKRRLVYVHALTVVCVAISAADSLFLSENTQFNV